MTYDRPAKAATFLKLCANIYPSLLSIQYLFTFLYSEGGEGRLQKRGQRIREHPFHVRVELANLLSKKTASRLQK